jgi:hypothetical protein
MSRAIENLTEAMKRAEEILPKAGGFPYLAEVLRQAGATRNVWSLPSCQSLFLTQEGPIIMQGTPLVSGVVDVPRFDEDALIRALRIDQPSLPESLLYPNDGYFKTRFSSKIREAPCKFSGISYPHPTQPKSPANLSPFF